MNTYSDVITAYDGQAEVLAERYGKVSSELMLAEVLPVIPSGGDRRLALDVGAGIGRDAAWLTSLCYDVVAVEPVHTRRFDFDARHNLARCPSGKILSQKGKLHLAIGQRWRRVGAEVIPFFAFLNDVGRIIYTTSAIGALDANLRRAGPSPWPLAERRGRQVRGP